MKQIFEGVVKKSVEHALQQLNYYQSFLNGTKSRWAFHQDLLSDEDRLLTEFGLSIDEVRFASRYPRDEEQKVDEWLGVLFDNGLLPNKDYDKRAFNLFSKRMDGEFVHAGNRTFIYPEEARLVYAVTSILQPGRTAVLGSFYGWWAFWALPAIRESGGSLLMVDTKREVCELASLNLKVLGFQDVAEVVHGDAIGVLAQARDPLDFILLDAEGDCQEPRLSHRGKAVYGPILQALISKLSLNAVVVCHNILCDELCQWDDYLAQKRKTYDETYQQFHSLTDRTFDVSTHLDSTEGVGVYGRPRSHYYSIPQL